MQSSPVILLAVVCGFFVIIGAMVALVIFTTRKENARKGQVAQALGCTPTADSQSLLERIAYVNGIQHPEMYRLTHVFQRSAPGGTVYLFDFHRRDIRNGPRRDGSRSSKIHYHPLEADALAFVSPAWKLPRFTASSRISGGGKLAELGNRISEATLEIKQDVVKFPQIHNLDEMYLIATAESPSSQFNLPDAFLRVLAGNPNLKLHAGGDTLTLSHANNTTQPPNEEAMKQLYSVAVQLARTIS
jgi:hypothetical protein